MSKHTIPWSSSRALAQIESIEALEPILKKYASGFVLDVGCGQKPYTNLLPSKTEYLGLDLQAADVLANAHDLPVASKSVETVLSNQVIEHLSDPNQFFSEANRVLKPNGIIILTTPMTWPLHDEPYDYWRFTPHGLRLLSERHGFEVILSQKTGGYLSTVWQLFAAIIERPSLHAGLLRKLWGTSLKIIFSLIQPLIYWFDQTKKVEGLTVSVLLVARKKT